MNSEYEFWLVDDRSVLDGLRQAYYAGLKGPVEPWLEEQTHRAYYFAIRHQAALIGYACIDSEDRLLQFYVTDEHVHEAQGLFARLIDSRLMSAAFVSTRSPAVLSLCMDCQKTVSCQAYLFEDRALVDCPIDGIDDEIRFRPAEGEDLARILAVSDDFFAPTAARIERKMLYMLEGAGEILALGMIETDDCHPRTTAAVGMFTHPDFRRRGIGAHMIMRLKERCYAMGHTPIAGCWYQNIASKRTLERAGMMTKDRMLRIDF